MSHTNSTAHYELPQFLGTDKPAWLTDVNGAMSAIDTAIYSAQTKANEADAKATQNTSDITSQGNQISTLSGKVTALETAQPLDEAQIQLNKQNISTNAQNIVDIDNRLGHVDISAYGSTQTGAIKNIGDKTVNKCVTTDEEIIGEPALKAYAVGEYFIGKTDRNLYKVTSAISISDVLAVGTNCIVADIANELTELNADKANEIITDTLTASEESVSANTVKTLQISCTKTGYTPIGVVSFTITGTYNDEVNTYGIDFNSDKSKVNVRCRNNHSGTNSVGAKVVILYQKN